jgi:hypothetical protein
MVGTVVTMPDSHGLHVAAGVGAQHGAAGAQGRAAVR